MPGSGKSTVANSAAHLYIFILYVRRAKRFMILYKSGNVKNVPRGPAWPTAEKCVEAAEVKDLREAAPRVPGAGVGVK